MRENEIIDIPTPILLALLTLTNFSKNDQYVVDGFSKAAHY